MKIAVMGAGALGCYFGGRLAASGVDVSFIARGEHLKALQKNGLRIESPLGDLVLEQVNATDNPGEIGPVDMVFFLVKLPDTETAAGLLKPLLKENTGVLSFQNGIDAWDRIGERIGSDHVIGGTTAIPADIREPGIIRHSASFASLVFGEFGGHRTQRCETLLALLENADVKAELVDNIEVRIWEKFVMLSAFSAATSITRLPIGPVRSNSKSRKLLRQLVDETFSVARKACPGLSETHADWVMDFLDQAPEGMRSSMLDDLTRGKPLEVEYLSGAVVRKAHELELEARAHQLVLRALSPFADGPPNMP